MKLALTLGLLITSVAYAATMPYTIIYTEQGDPVRCGTPVFTSQVEAYPDGSQAGLVYQRTSCSSGGRGSRPRSYSACASVEWNPDGTVEYVDVIWTTLPPATVRPVTDCITG